MITDLRSLYHCRIVPTFRDARCDHPFHSSRRRTLGNLATQDEPAVVMVHTTIVKFQVTSQRFNGQTCIRIIRTRREFSSYGIRLGNDVIGNHRTIALTVQLSHIGLLTFTCEVIARMLAVGGCLQQRAIRLLRIEARMVIHHPGLTKERAREELQIKTYLTQQKIRHRFVEVDSNDNTTAPALSFHLIVKLVIGIKRRIKTRQMT